MWHVINTCSEDWVGWGTRRLELLSLQYFHAGTPLSLCLPRIKVSKGILAVSYTFIIDFFSIATLFMGAELDKWQGKRGNRPGSCASKAPSNTVSMCGHTRMCFLRCIAGACSGPDQFSAVALAPTPPHLSAKTQRGSGAVPPHRPNLAGAKPRACFGMRV